MTKSGGKGSSEGGNSTGMPTLSMVGIVALIAVVAVLLLPQYGTALSDCPTPAVPLVPSTRVAVRSELLANAPGE